MDTISVVIEDKAQGTGYTRDQNGVEWPWTISEGVVEFDDYPPESVRRKTEIEATIVEQNT